MNATYRSFIRPLLAGRALRVDQANRLVGAMMGGRLEPAQVAAVLTALELRGPTLGELVGFARAMRTHMRPVPTDLPVIDTCGTGGSGLETANTSTMAALVIAAAGVPVAKHGNRASSGKCGSADLLEALGVDVSLPPERAEVLLAELGFAFFFAPIHHPAMKHVVPVRKQLGFRTVFNFLGPLCNPAGARRQLLGVSDANRAEQMARALEMLGSERVLVVHGDDGLDEISLCGPTRTWELRGGIVVESRIEPADFGLDPVPFEAIAGGDTRRNAEIAEAVLSGKDDGPHAAHLALNAGAAFYVAGAVDTIAAGVERARQVLASGAALELIERYASRSVAVAA